MDTTPIKDTKAWLEWLPRVLGSARAEGVNVDVDGGLERATDLVALARAEPVKGRLALLPEVIFPADRVAALEQTVALTRSLDALQQGAASDAKAEEALLDEAESLRATLNKLLDYHFGDDPAVASELAEGRPKRGAFRLAAALARLATLAEERAQALASDTKHWRPTLVADARRVAQTLCGLSGALTEREVVDVKRRAFAMVEAHFVDVRQAIAFVMRHDATCLEQLPVLRKPAVRKPRVDGAASEPHVAAK